MRLSLRLVALLAAAALATTACSNDSSGETSPSDADTDASPGEPVDAAEDTEEETEPKPLWSDNSFNPVSAPVAVADKVVVYTARNRKIYLTVVDPETGEKVVERRSSSSYTTPGVTMSVESQGDLVYHYAPSGHQRARLQVYDVAADEVVSETGADRYWGAPSVCNDEDEGPICLVAGERPPELYRLDDQTGGLTRLAGDLGRGLGSALYDGDEDDRIMRVIDGEVVWRTTAPHMFGGKSVDPDRGWSWDERDGHLIGSFGADDAPERGAWQVGPGHAASIDVETGEPLWVKPGHTFCGTLKRMDLTVDDQEPWFRCAAQGTVRVTGEALENPDLTHRIISFDPETGNALWTTERAPWDTLFLGSSEWIKLGESVVAGKQRGKGVHTLDVSTGEVAAADPKQVGWCIQSKWYKDENSYADDQTRVAGNLATPCRANGKPVRRPSFADSAFGAEVGDIFVWASKKGLHAVNVG